MPKILITIDVELGDRATTYYTGTNAFDVFVLGQVENAEVGVLSMVNEILKCGFNCDIFLDIYGTVKYGMSNFSQICDYFLRKNCDVHLHTHPFLLYNRYNLHELTYAEQNQLIADGKSMLKECAGISPNAHRAGSYSADNNTLIALHNNHLIYDASFFHAHHNCKITGISGNSITKVNNLTEIPVTVFRKTKIHKFWRKHYSKLDLNWVDPDILAQLIVNKFNKNDVVTVFLHSASFLQCDFSITDKQYKAIRINKELYMKFLVFLKFLAQHTAAEPLKITEISQPQFVNLPHIIEL